ncbi:MAG: hypothetical protein SOY80_02515 [Bacilli bacterium]|nr:hypothetical protein [Bacilli bacterium]
MAELLINENDIEKLVKSYNKVDKTFSYIDGYKENTKKYVFVFFIENKKCQLTIYIKKGSCNVIPCGNNIVECNKLIDYLKTKCIDANVKSESYSIKCEREYSESLLKYLKEANIANINKKNHKDQYELIGYAGDIVHYNIYDKKLVIQGKFLCLFGVIFNYLNKFIDISQIINSQVDINKQYLVSEELLENEIRNKIGEAYDYVDENLRKSLTSSYKLIDMCNNSTLRFGDYTGLLTGAFKMLEGYLKKILLEKYGYTNNNKTTFKMFYVSSDSGKSDIDIDQNIGEEEKIYLKKLYTLFSCKRNIFSHGSGVTGDTQIISNFSDAKHILAEILETINKSYIIFK